MRVTKQTTGCQAKFTVGTADKGPAQNVWRTETNDEGRASNSIKVFGAVWFSEGREWVSVNPDAVVVKRQSRCVSSIPYFPGFGEVFNFL